jgi:hypothetical protein
LLYVTNPGFENLIWSWWGDIGVRTWNVEDSQKPQLTEEILQTFHVAIKLSESSF